MNVARARDVFVVASIEHMQKHFESRRRKSLKTTQQQQDENKKKPMIRAGWWGEEKVSIYLDLYTYLLCGHTRLSRFFVVEREK